MSTDWETEIYSGDGRADFSLRPEWVSELVLRAQLEAFNEGVEAAARAIDDVPADSGNGGLDGQDVVDAIRALKKEAK